MSGICGALGRTGLIDETKLRAMLARMHHRGRRESTFAANGSCSVGMGHVDLEAFAPRGAGPVGGFVRSGHLVAALEGCITNRDELVAQLPPSPDLGTDAGLACAAYRAFGDDCLARLDGPFSLALWDEERRRLLLSRDKIGEKSLYYSFDPATGDLAFATEIKSILADAAFPRLLDRESLSLHLVFGYVPGPRTLLQDVYKLLPGECVSIEEGRPPQRRRYYSLPAITDVEMSEDECLVTLRDLFLRALERYVAGCSDVAVFLSGGIDSTILVAALRELGVSGVSSFTIGFTLDGSRPQTDDLHYARLIAERYGTDHHELTVASGHDPIERFVRVVRQFDDLIMTPNSYSKCLLAEAVRDAGVRSVLTGSAAAGACGIHRKFVQHEGRRKWLEKTKGCTSDEERYHVLRGRLFGLEQQRSLLREGPAIDEGYVLEALGHYVRTVEAPDFFRRFLFSNLMITSTEKSLRVLDRVCAMSSLECRSPFVERNIVDFSTRLPTSFDGGRTIVSLKTEMEKAFAAELPREVRERPVIGYPSFYWETGELRPLQERLLSREALLEGGIFDPDGVARVLEEEAVSDAKSVGKHAWSLTQLSLWYEIHVKRNPEFC